MSASSPGNGNGAKYRAWITVTIAIIMLIASFGGGWLGASYKEGVNAQRQLDTEAAVSELKAEMKQCVQKENYLDDRQEMRDSLKRIEKKVDDLLTNKR